ncbi:MAG: DUF362 domain-containing protein [Phycisphaerae bacterium]|nr:DUF362 domain-containing protein [Phycisphaerae bacterium]
MNKISRRCFVQGSITAGAAASLPFIFVRRSQAAWAAGTTVHPNIDNLRVVGITDAKMTKEVQARSNWARQEQLVNTEAVQTNIDKLACALAKAKDPKEAWKAIFVKPPKKSWGQTVVAVKTNNISVQHTRSPVMAKVCHVLTDVLGVKPANVHIYDACHGEDMKTKTPFKGLPEGCRLESKWGGSTVRIPVGKPFKGGAVKCLKPLTDGSVDILVNIAMCKGHQDQHGGFTMTMKNHLGSFEPTPAHKAGMDYLVGINQSPQILGALDKKSGKLLYPRQQLCLIDALWASEKGPFGPPSAQPNFMAMGVLGPAVDYLVATEFRGKKMGWKPNVKPLEGMLSAFGIKKEDMGTIIPA